MNLRRENMQRKIMKYMFYYLLFVILITLVVSR